MAVSQTDSGSDSDCGPRPPTTDNRPEKRRRVMGPAMPPSAVASAAADDSSSSDDDDFGPRPPTLSEQASASEAAQSNYTDMPEEEDTKPQRAGWMTAPPTSSKPVDPMRRPGRFNTSRHHRPAGKTGEIDALWTESLDEKQKRVRAEVLGEAPRRSGRDAGPTVETAKERAEREAAKKVRERIDKGRGRTLVEQKMDHKKTAAKAGSNKDNDKEEDDPSARPFDYTKDVAGGTKINATGRRELVAKMGAVGDRFAGGKFL